jgi:hypothetical protein
MSHYGVDLLMHYQRDITQQLTKYYSTYLQMTISITMVQFTLSFGCNNRLSSSIDLVLIQHIHNHTVVTAESLWST